MIILYESVPDVTTKLNVIPYRTFLYDSVFIIIRLTVALSLTKQDRISEYRGWKFRQTEVVCGLGPHRILP